MVKRFTFLFVFLFFYTEGFSQVADSREVIPWDEKRQLAISDFNVIPDHSDKISGNNLAITRTGITYTLKQRPGSKVFEIRLFATMHPANSFIRQKVVDAPAGSISYLLEHEQKHFDISEIFAREAMKRLSAKRFSGNYKKEVNNFMQLLFKESEIYQDRYDQETRNGGDAAAQQLWNEKIVAKLNELNTYKNKVLQRRIY